MFKFKNKILLLIFSLQIFANFNSEVLCSRTDAQGLHVATAVAKYLAFATSNAYGLKGDESKELKIENIYLALDIFSSILKIEYFLKDQNLAATNIATLSETGLIIYDIVSFAKNINKLQTIGNIKNCVEGQSKSDKQKLSSSIKKKILYTFLQHFAHLAEVEVTVDFAGNSSKRLKSADALFSIFLKIFSRCLDNKLAEIPYKKSAIFSFLGIAFMEFIIVNVKASDARWKHLEEEWKAEREQLEKQFEEEQEKERLRKQKENNEYWERRRKSEETAERRRQENMPEDERYRWKEQQDRNKKEQEKRQKEWDDYIESLRRRENARREQREWRDRLRGYGTGGFYGARNRNQDFWGNSYGFGGTSFYDDDFDFGGLGSGSSRFRSGSSGFSDTGSGFFDNDFNFGSTGPSFSNSFRSDSSGFGSTYSGLGSDGSSYGSGSSSFGGGASGSLPRFNPEPPIPHASASRPTFYTLLGVLPNANSSEINRNYKKIALKTHPDKGGQQELFTAIGSARDTLLDSEKRRKYDLYLRTGFESEPDYNIPNQDAEGIKKIREEIKI